jgi:hypothetical protein
MSEQTSLFGPTLPPEFVAEWRRLEAARDMPKAVLSAEMAERKAMGWWLVLRVSGRRVAVANRADLVQAARDLFTQVHGGAQ